MNALRRLALCFIPLLFACTTLPLQIAEHNYKNKDFDKARAIWIAMVDYDRNPVALANLGLLAEFGYGSTSRNLRLASEYYLESARKGFTPAMVRLAGLQKNAGHENAALSWAIFAARWGNLDARKLLVAWGRPVPTDDLRQAQINKERMEAEQRNREFTEVIALVALGAAAAASARHGSTNELTSILDSTASSTSTSSTMTTGTRGCTSDYDCGHGNRCVKPPFSSEGVCHRAVDASGVPTLSAPRSKSFDIQTGPGCRVFSDCPVGFRCDPMLKACVK